MEPTIEEIVAKIKNTNPYENLNEILGEDMGSLIYQLVNKIDENIMDCDINGNDVRVIIVKHNS